MSLKTSIPATLIEAKCFNFGYSDAEVMDSENRKWKVIGEYCYIVSDGNLLIHKSKRNGSDSDRSARIL